MIFGNFKTIDQFQLYINDIDDWTDLNQARLIVLAWNKHQHPHALRDPQKGFESLIDLLDARATEMGLLIYSFGYRKPSTTKKS
jgi:hypothetical protein